MTYEDFLRIFEAEERKIEFHNGKLIYLSPATPNHNLIKMELYYRLRLKYPNKNIYVSMPLLIRIKNKIFQFTPDIMIVENNNFKNNIYEGVPEIIVEVVSNETKITDTKLKSSLYAKIGVKQYLIVDDEEVR